LIEGLEIIFMKKITLFFDRIMGVTPGLGLPIFLLLVGQILQVIALVVSLHNKFGLFR